VYALVAVLATLSVPLLYRLAGFTLADEMQWLESREAADHESMLARLATLRGQLDNLGIEEGVRQADTLTAILDDYHSVVETLSVCSEESAETRHSEPDRRGRSWSQSCLYIET